MAYNIPLKLEMLTGQGIYISTQAQSQIGNLMFYDQVKSLAIKALKSITLPKAEELFRNLIQSPNESFLDFLSKVTEAIVKRVPSGPAQDSLIKQLVWEVQML